MARQSNAHNIQAETPSTDLKNMMEKLELMEIDNSFRKSHAQVCRWLRSHKYLPMEYKRAVTTHFRSKLLSKIK